MIKHSISVTLEPSNFLRVILNALILYISFLSIPIVGYVLYVFFKKMSEFRKWTTIKKKKFPQKYDDILNKSFYPYHFLSDDEKNRLKLKILYFLEYKHFSSIGDFEITESIKLIIAAQACLLIVNLDNGVYPSLYNIYISASTFIEKEQYIEKRTMLPAHVPRLGESWKDGPIVLSWNSIRSGAENWNDGQNVVLHEFAHQLDSLEGAMNGVPSLEKNTSKKWSILMSREFRDLREKVLNHKQNDFGEYALTNASEFFAVTVEHFFEKPHELEKNHMELFELYKNYFKIDPLKWTS